MVRLKINVDGRMGIGTIQAVDIEGLPHAEAAIGDSCNRSFRELLILRSQQATVCQAIFRSQA